MKNLVGDLNRWRVAPPGAGGPPLFNVTVAILLAICAADVVAIWLHGASLVATVCIYASGLILLSELLADAGVGLWGAVAKQDGVAKLRSELERKARTTGPLTAAEKAELNLQRRSSAAFNLHFWFAVHVIALVRRTVFLLRTKAWVDERDLAVDRYLLRFAALVFLLLAIDFEIIGRIF